MTNSLFIFSIRFTLLRYLTFQSSIIQYIFLHSTTFAEYFLSSFSHYIFSVTKYNNSDSFRVITSEKKTSCTGSIVHVVRTYIFQTLYLKSQTFWTFSHWLCVDAHFGGYKPNVPSAERGRNYFKPSKMWLSGSKYRLLLPWFSF